MAVSPEQARKIALQHLRTTQLLGVDFVPCPRVGVGLAADKPAEVAEVEDESRATSKPVAAERAKAPVAPAPRPRSGGGGDKAAALAALRVRHDTECPHCTRVKGTYTQTVFSDGDANARLMIIGEAPGAEEDRLGIPFVGRSGELLNQMLTAMGLTRESVYIANVLKARPPNNDTPTGEEAAKCGPYLKEQIAIVQPEVIVTMGNPATQYILNTKQGITSLRGVWQSYEGIPLMPTFHPAFLLRQYTPENRKKVWSDLQEVMKRLKD